MEDFNSVLYIVIVILLLQVLFNKMSGDQFRYLFRLPLNFADEISFHHFQTVMFGALSQEKVVQDLS
jgi:hypothetical protein